MATDTPQENAKVLRFPRAARTFRKEIGTVSECLDVMVDQDLPIKERWEASERGLVLMGEMRKALHSRMFGYDDGK
jgi:hypothetical protein